MQNIFIIDQVSWHTKKERNYVLDNNRVLRMFFCIIMFLQENNLTNHTILKSLEEVNDETCIKSSDLTSEGLELMRKHYGKWVDSFLDNDKFDDKLSTLITGLKKIREKVKKK